MTRRSEFDLAGVGSGFGLSLVLLLGTANSRVRPNNRSRIWSYVYIPQETRNNRILAPDREFRLSGKRVSPRRNRLTDSTPADLRYGNVSIARRPVYPNLKYSPGLGSPT